jgi:hypothetical protein
MLVDKLFEFVLDPQSKRKHMKNAGIGLPKKAPSNQQII